MPGDLNLQYDESSIYTPEGLDLVRTRKTEFITDSEVMGQWHIAKELIDNSIDELELKGRAGNLTIVLLRDLAKKKYQMVVRDNGRGVPIGAMYNAFTVLHTSGKFNTSAYNTSSGLFGVGAKAAAGLSNFFRVFSVRGKEEGIGDLLVQRGKVPSDITKCDYDDSFIGTTVVYEPDDSIFSHIEEFMTSGYNELLNLLQKFSLFCDYQITFRISSIGVKDNFWKMPTEDARSMVDNLIATSEVIYDSIGQQSNRSQYIKDYFELARPWAWNDRFTSLIGTVDNQLGFDILTYAVKYDNTGGHIALVNNVPIDDTQSSHILQFKDTIKSALAPYIKDVKIQKYFLETYRIPLYFAMSVKFSGAEFTGTTKHAFRNSAFRDQFHERLLTILKEEEHVKKLTELYVLLEEDIVSKYEQFTNGSIVIKNSKKLMLDLNFPEKFSDCNTTDRSIATLFLTEGDSAGSNEGRDPLTQATYSLRGKPINVVTVPDTKDQSVDMLKANKITKDIITLLGISRTQKTFDDVRYGGGLFIMVDADSHGGHIAIIVLGDLYEYNSHFIESGLVHVVTPPLYALRMKKNKNDELIYIRDADDMVNAMAQHVYYHTFDVDIVVPGQFEHTLSEEEFVEFARIVCYVGDMISRLSKEHVVDPLILEQLTYVTQYLSPSTMNVEYLREFFNNPNISYDPIGNILMMSIGRDDIIMSLHGIAESLYREVLPWLRKIEWQKFGIFVTTKHTDLYQKQLVSIVQLYQLFQSLDDFFIVERYKGLGSMEPEDRKVTCMDPENRITTQITTIGDFNKIYHYLGTDSQWRKAQLETTNAEKTYDALRHG